MSVFRLTQITDTHLSPRIPAFTANFDRVAAHIDATRPDLVINTGDLAFDGPDHPDDLVFARARHDALPVEVHVLPGNHDIGDNPTAVGAPLLQQASEDARQRFVATCGPDRWRFDAAGWSFIGLNTLIMNTGLASEAAQRDWLARELAKVRGRPLALFLHKPLFRDTPDDPELAETSFRYVPMPVRSDLVAMLRDVDLRLVACGHVHQRRDVMLRGVRHVWAPSAAFIIRSDAKQEPIGVKEVGLVEYAFTPDDVEVRHLRAVGQVDIDLATVDLAAALG